MGFRVDHQMMVQYVRVARRAAKEADAVQRGEAAGTK
jgi:hypothetical protein